MKDKIILLLFSMFSVLAYGQNRSFIIDEMTAHHLRQLSEEQRLHFDSILLSRAHTKWLKRMDRLKFDYAFIEETICEQDHSIRTEERYFNEGDSIPAFIYFDGEKGNPEKIYDGFFIWYSKNVTYYQTFKPLLEAYSKFQPVQELAYNKMQVWKHGCVTEVNGLQIFAERRTAELKTTYRINTMIDKKSNTILVSIQFAPTTPKFETFSYNGVWDW